jgi:hypothetical protein
MADVTRFTNNSDLIEVPGVGSLLLRKNGDRNAVAFLDPITQKILIELGQALLSSLGAAIFKKIFGKDESAELPSILRGLIHEIANLLSEIIDASEVRAATSQASAAATLLAEYSRSPETIPGRLNQALFMSTEAVDLLGRILPASASAYAFAAYTKLATLQQIVLETQSEGEAENFRAFASNTTLMLTEAYSQLIAKNSARITAVESRDESYDPNHLRPGGGLPWVRRFVSFYTVDKSEKQFVAKVASDALAAANEQHKADSARIAEEFDFRVGLGLSKAIENFQALRTWKRDA